MGPQHTPNSTRLNSDWSDWGVDTSHTTSHNKTTQSGRIGTSTRTKHRAEKERSRCGNQPFSSSEVAIESWPQVDRDTRGTDNTTPRRPPPCGTCRRSAVATSYIIWQGGTTESGPHSCRLAVATTKTQRAGASPHPPLDSTTLSSPRKNTTRWGLAMPTTILLVTDPFLKSPSR